jgi:hypothetical protein
MTGIFIPGQQRRRRLSDWESVAEELETWAGASSENWCVAGPSVERFLPYFIASRVLPRLLRVDLRSANEKGR